MVASRRARDRILHFTIRPVESDLNDYYRVEVGKAAETDLRFDGDDAALELLDHKFDYVDDAQDAGQAVFRYATVDVAPIAARESRSWHRGMEERPTMAQQARLAHLINRELGNPMSPRRSDVTKQNLERAYQSLLRDYRAGRAGKTRASEGWLSQTRGELNFLGAMRKLMSW
jgi:hypothetical protein